jgi:hypothetical protein
MHQTLAKECRGVQGTYVPESLAEIKDGFIGTCYINTSCTLQGPNDWNWKVSLSIVKTFQKQRYQEQVVEMRKMVEDFILCK